MASHSNRQGQYYVGIDIGGTKSLVAIGTAAGEIVDSRKAFTPDDPSAGLELLNTLISDLLGGQSPLGIGISVGGPLDWRSGVVSPLHQPAWRGLPLQALLTTRWQCAVALDVDTNVAALAEYYAAPADRLLYITVSTGVGGGLLINGAIYRGSQGEHPEIGHQAIPYRCRQPERIECACGTQSCLEALVSGRGIRRIYGVPASELGPDEWAEVSYNLAQGIRNCVASYLPAVVVLGGGVALGGGAPLVASIQALLKNEVRLIAQPIVRLSELGVHGPAIGALHLARTGHAELR